MSFENMVRVLMGESEAVAREVQAVLNENVTESRAYVKGVLALKV